MKLNNVFEITSNYFFLGYRLTWATLKTVCNDIINNLKEATELLHNVMSISQPFTAHSTSSTMDSDDNIHSHVKSFKNFNFLQN